MAEYNVRGFHKCFLSQFSFPQNGSGKNRLVTVSAHNSLYCPEHGLRSEKFCPCCLLHAALSQPEPHRVRGWVQQANCLRRIQLPERRERRQLLMWAAAERKGCHKLPGMDFWIVSGWVRSIMGIFYPVIWLQIILYIHVYYYIYFC